MGFTIAVAGKGGVGKTTLAGLLVGRLIARGRTPVLAVDADPNICLDRVLGVRVEKTVGGLREDSNAARPEGMDKHRYLELRVAESLVEADAFDLIAMGRPEGPGCYCYANAVLKDILARVVDEYPYIVIDNEAGLENLSRRLVARADALVLVADPSQRGLETVKRLYDLAREMQIDFSRLVIVINRLRTPELPAAAAGLKDYTGADLLLGLPADTTLAEMDEQGAPLLQLAEGNAVLRGVERVLEGLGL